MSENSLDTKPNSVSLLSETNILKRRIGSIPQWDVVKRAATTSKEYFEAKLNAKEQSTSNNDPSIFDDAYDDNERQISGLSYFPALQMLLSSASDETGIPITNNTYSRIVTSDEPWGSAKDDSKSIMTQSQDVNAIHDRMPLTKETKRAFVPKVAGNLASTLRPFKANDTIKSWADVASSSLFMPKTDIHDVPFKSCEIELEIRATAANHEVKHDIVNPNIAPMTEEEKVQLVISNASICDTRFSRSTQPAILSSSEKTNGVTFVGEDEITDADILSGRGGKSNQHVGNKRFRYLVSEMKTMYRSAGQKTHKTALSQGIIAYVHSYGGRFLTQDRTANDPQWRGG